MKLKFIIKLNFNIVHTSVDRNVIKSLKKSKIILFTETKQYSKYFQWHIIIIYLMNYNYK